MRWLRKRVGVFSFLAVLLCCHESEAVITYFASASTPADNGSNTVDLITVTPPASMVAGDLVLVEVVKQGAGYTFSVNTTGGQSWTQYASVNNAPNHALFWARFDGTWTADPKFDATLGDTAISAIMHVFRPTVSACTWALDVTFASSSYTAAADITITGITRVAASAIALAAWNSDPGGGQVITWGTLVGTGWSKTGLAAQYRNTGGSDISASFAYNIGTGATNDVTQTQSFSSAGTRSIVSFAETCPSGSKNRALLGVG